MSAFLEFAADDYDIEYDVVKSLYDNDPTRFYENLEEYVREHKHNHQMQPTRNYGG